MNNTADIVVIGGGVMGTSIAFELGRRKAGSVVVLEKSFLGAGSSGQSGANIRRHYSHPLTADMAQFGLRMFENFPEVVGGPSVFTRTGMVVVMPQKDRRRLEATIALQHRLGIQVSLVSREELSSIDPNAGLADDEVAAYEPEAGYCDPAQVMASFAAAARERGVEIREGSEATGIMLDGGKVSGVASAAGVISTRTVIIAAGPWASSLAAKVGAKLPVKPCRVQVALLRRPPEMVWDHPLYADYTNQIYFKTLPGGLVHLGNIDTREENAEVDPDDFPATADQEFLREMRAKLIRRYSGMKRSTGRGAYSALYAVTPDWHPVIDHLPGVEGAICAAGFSGHGFKLAPAAGKLVGELALDGAATTFDIAPLRASRYDEGDLFGSGASASVMG